MIINIVGNVENKKEFLNKTVKKFPYWINIQFISIKNKERLSKLGYKASNKTKIYICNPSICFFSTDNLEDFGIIIKIFQIYKTGKIS